MSEEQKIRDMVSFEAEKRAAGGAIVAMLKEKKPSAKELAEKMLQGEVMVLDVNQAAELLYKEDERHPLLSIIREAMKLLEEERNKK